MILEFLNELTNSGYRIFAAKDAKEIAKSLCINESSIPRILKSLIEKNMIRSLLRGVYAIEDHILAGAPLHKYEVALYLAPEGAISCWSAMNILELTDQVLTTVLVLIPHTFDQNRCTCRYKIDGYEYILIQTHQNHFWGMEYKRFGEAKIRMTDLERTLLDGLTRPSHCGGFREVLNAFSIAQQKIDLGRMIDYAHRCPTSVRKRLGYVLQHLNFSISTDQLDLEPTSYFDKLDIAGERRGTKNIKWMLLENF